MKPLDLEAIEARAGVRCWVGWFAGILKDWTSEGPMPRAEAMVRAQMLSRTHAGYVWVTTAPDEDGATLARWADDKLVKVVEPDPDLPALLAEVRELRAELENERGEGVGPSEGWGWCNYKGTTAWRRGQRDDLEEIVGTSLATVLPPSLETTGRVWIWRVRVKDEDAPGGERTAAHGTAKTARSAMRAASLALNPPENAP